MQIFFWILIFLLSTFILVKSANYFTKYAEKVGFLFGLSSFIIGATIVAIGTSLPELIASLYAVINTTETSFVVDQIVGSNIANALLILGIGAVTAKTLKVHTSLIDIDLPFFFMSMGLLVFFTLDAVITWNEGIFLLAFFFIFGYYNATTGDSKQDADELIDLKEQYNGNSKHFKLLKSAKYISLILISVIFLALSSKYFIDSILTLADLLNITSSFLIITIASIGTSLPEVITSLAAIRLGNHGMAIGNVFGSNTFNIALVGSLPTFFGDLAVSPKTLSFGIPFLIFATLLAIFATLDNKIQKWEGIAMLFFYGLFLAEYTNLI